MTSPSASFTSLSARATQLTEVLKKHLNERDRYVSGKIVMYLPGLQVSLWCRLEAAGEDGSKPGRLAQRKARDLTATLDQLKEVIGSRPYRRVTDEATQAEHEAKVAGLRDAAEALGRQLAAGRVYGEKPAQHHKDVGEDHEEVVARQRQEMEAQDEGLDQLHDVIRRQRDISVNIFGQIDEQNMMLDELDEAIERTHMGMDSATRRIQSFLLDTKDGAVCGEWPLLAGTPQSREWGGTECLALQGWCWLWCSSRSLL